MVNERHQKLLRTCAILFTLWLGAWLCARGVTQLLAAALLPTEGKAPVQSARLLRNTQVAAQAEPTPRALAMAALSRNIFDSQTGAMEWEPPYVEPTPEPTVEGTEPVADPTGEPQVCQGTLRLVGAFVVPRVPGLSVASIAANGQTLLYRSGIQVDGHHIVGIREHRVFMRPSGRPLCQITMFKPPDAPVQPAVAPTEQPDDPWTPGNNVVQGGLTEDELEQGIKQLGDTQYQIDRSVMDKALSNQDDLMRAARVVPYEEDGRMIGMKVYGIRRKSLLGRLGVQNGDVLRKINGFDLSSPDSALELYTKLRTLDQFTIAMTRRGELRNMNYAVK